MAGLIFITITKQCPGRLAALHRAVDCFRTVEDLLWLVVEVGPRMDPAVERLLRWGQLPYHYWAVESSGEGDAAQRSAALECVRQCRMEGVIYQADAEHEYDPMLFEELRGVERVALLQVDDEEEEEGARPVVSNGILTGWQPERSGLLYPVRPAGFAFHSSLLSGLEPPLWGHQGTGMASDFLARIVTGMEDFSLLGRGCGDCLVRQHTPPADLCDDEGLEPGADGLSPTVDLIFVHHRNDAVTERNFASFLKYAPAWCRVVPVHVKDGCESYLPQSQEVSLESFPRNHAPRIHGVWSEADLVMGAWCEQYASRATCIVQVEYDVQAHQSLAPLLRTCLAVDCTGNHRHAPVHGYWAETHSEVKGPDWLLGKSQMIPLAFRSCRRELLAGILHEIRTNPEWHNVYCELRWPSVTDRLGLRTRYLHFPPEAFWWQGPGIPADDSRYPLTHPSKT
jgi:Glycosyltransferase family 43